jgi:hypothetical protein
MTSLEQYSNRPYVSFSERMQQNAARRQLMQDEAIKRQYNQQKNELDLAQAQQKLQQDLQNYEQGYNGNTPSAIQEYNFLSKLSPREQALYLRAKAPNSQIQFENMGMMDGMGDVGNINQPMTMPAPQRQPAAPSRRQPSMQQGPIVPTDGEENLPVPAPTMPTGAPLPSPQNGGINTTQTTRVVPPKYLGNGEYEFMGKRGYNQKNSDLAYRSALSVQSAQDKVIAKEYADAFTNYTLTGPQAAIGRAQDIENLNNQYARLGYAESGVVGGRLPAISPEAQQFDTASATLQTANNPYKGQGAISNFEREIFARTLPSRSYRKETMQKTFEASKALKEIQLEKQRFVSNWQQQNGSWNAQGEIALKEYIEPIAQKKFYALYPEEAGANAQQPTQNAAQPMMPAAGGGFSIREIK